MRQIGILTDSSVQLPAGGFPGCEWVCVMPLHIRLGSNVYFRGEGVKVSQLPVSARDGLNPGVQPPSSEEIQEVYYQLGHSCDEIVAILISHHLNPTVDLAREAAATVRGQVNVHVIDSQSAGVGLGWLVQAAALAAVDGASGLEVKRLVLGLIPQIYTLFYISGLTYLAHAGFLDPAQAFVGEMMEMMPLFIMEGGRLIPIQKARSSRHLVDILYEFVGEFSDLQNIALIQGLPPFEQEARALRERIGQDYPHIPLSEQVIGIPMAVLFGPRSLGLFVMER